jgi:hypothetical protein
MFSWSESHVLCSNNDCFTSILNDVRILKDMDEKDMASFHCMVVPCNSHNFFTFHKIEEGLRKSMDPKVGIWNVLATMWTTLHFFKILINFTLVEFDELATLVVPTLSTHAQSISEVLISSLGFDFYFLFTCNFFL